MGYQPGEKTSDGYMALPPAGTGPGVLVLHAWWGLNDFFVELCDRLAGDGYVALAPDLYGGAIASTIEEAKALCAIHDAEAEANQEKVLQALDSLRQHPAAQGNKAGVLGCSMGVWWAMQVAAMRPEQVAAAVLFYGVVDVDVSAARCAFQGHFAENDAFDSLDAAQAMAEEMRAAGRDVAFYEYPGVGHWFLESDQPEAYDAAAAQLAWERTVSFLNSHLRL